MRSRFRRDFGLRVATLCCRVQCDKRGDSAAGVVGRKMEVDIVLQSNVGRRECVARIEINFCWQGKKRGTTTQVYVATNDDEFTDKGGESAKGSIADNMSREQV